MSESQFQVEIDEQTARGHYSNLAFISHSETEFVFDFVFLQPQTSKTKVLTRIVSSPIHAKRLLGALRDNIQKYESRFGAIQSAEPVPVPGKTTSYYQ